MSRVLIVDDHRLFREALGLLIARQADFEVAGEASDGCTAIRMAKDLEVDLVLLDVNLPDVNGVEVARHVALLPRRPKVVALSASDSEGFVAAMVQAGASGYLLKSCCFEELIAAVKTVLDGGTYVSKSLRHGLANRSLAIRRETSFAPAALTDREREVLQLIAHAYSTKEIGDRLNVSPKTVSTHRTHVMEKLGLTTVAALTRYALRENLTAEGGHALPSGATTDTAAMRERRASGRGAKRAGEARA
jgi:two-component system, NarL family, response regulator NreC